MGSIPAINSNIPMMAKVLRVSKGFGSTRLAVAIRTIACLILSLRHCSVGNQGGLLGGKCISAVSDW